jgi:hypothetical protein
MTATRIARGTARPAAPPKAHEDGSCCELRATMRSGTLAKLYLCRRPSSSNGGAAGAAVAVADGGFEIAADLPRGKADALARLPLVAFVAVVCSLTADTVKFELCKAAAQAESGGPVSAASMSPLLHVKLSRSADGDDAQFRERVRDAVWEVLELVRTRLHRAAEP